MAVGLNLADRGNDLSVSRQGRQRRSHVNIPTKKINRDFIISLKYILRICKYVGGSARLGDRRNK